MSGRSRSSMLALVVISTAAVIAACGGDRKPPARRTKEPPAVQVASVGVATIADRLELTGSVEPTRLARMASPVEGPVVACLVREGDRVSAGQLLARLGRAKGDNAVAASAQAELEKEELELGRLAKLVRSGALPGEEVDRSRVKVSEARARLARAQERLGDYRVAAPWGGVVSRVAVTVGDFVAARATLIELFDPRSLVLRFAVPEARAASVQVGAATAIVLDAFAGRRFQGRVVRVYPEIDRRTHTRIVEAAIEGEAALAPGMFARLELTLSTAAGALVVPAEAVLRAEGEAPAVFVITPQSLAERRRVRPGIEDAGRVQILEGLARGERVAVGGHARLRPGAKVRLVRSQAGPAAARPR